MLYCLAYVNTAQVAFLMSCPAARSLALAVLCTCSCVRDCDCCCIHTSCSQGASLFQMWVTVNAFGLIPVNGMSLAACSAMADVFTGEGFAYLKLVFIPVVFAVVLNILNEALSHVSMHFRFLCACT